MMRKEVISSLLCITLTLTGAGVIFAADTQTGVEGQLTSDKITEHTGEKIRLSLEDAIQRMQTEGIRAQTAQINKDTDKAIADNYAETLSSIRTTLDNLNSMSGMPGSIDASALAESSGATALNEKVMKLRRDFAKTNIEKNYQAEMNGIEKETVQLYYHVLQAQDNLKAAQDNLTIQKSILSNVQKKFNAGVAAKKDVMSAQTSVTEAQSSLKSAEVALASLKMNLNMLLGYDLTQELVLTDTLKMLDAPTVTLKQAIQNAKENRLDIKAANLAAEIQKMLMDNLKLTISAASSTYKKQQVSYMTTKQYADLQPTQVELDIRTKHMGLEEKKAAVDSATASAEMAQEAYRLAQISYDAGVNTLTDVQEAQLLAFKTTQAVAAAVTEYDLAIYDFKYAQDVGTMRVTL